MQLWKRPASAAEISVANEQVTLFAPPWLDAFFSITQSAWSNSVTGDELSEFHKQY